MRPTKEIIELSKKLHELGHKQQKHSDTWIISSFGNNEWIDLARNIGATATAAKRIPIPSLEDGFSFLKEHGFIEISITDLMGSFDIQSERDDGIYYSSGETLHESILNFMVEIIEQRMEAK